MYTNTTFASASAYSLLELANIFTRSFADYFYPGTTTPEQLSRRVREEQIDLYQSQILLVDNAPAGIALIARRGGRAWCAGFGIMANQRGRGFAHLLAQAMLTTARSAGATHFALEVLTRNERALRTYTRVGLQIARRLLLVSWRPGENEPPAPPMPLTTVDPHELVLRDFAALHHVPAAWQREPASLLSLANATGLRLDLGTQRAYAIVSGDVQSMRIHDFAASDTGSANLLIGALKNRSRNLISINEPHDSPLTAAFLRNGFSVADEQHAMEMPL
jgi:ribosomal protein S18 acetylase RimI-like enzyme